MITKGGGAEAAGRQAEAGQDQRQGERAAGGRRAGEPGGGVVVILAGTVIARPPVVPGHDADLPAGSPLTRPGSPFRLRRPGRVESRGAPPPGGGQAADETGERPCAASRGARGRVRARE